MGADAEQTRLTILRAAREVMAERGYHASTFQQIAARAGVSRPTLHYYFGTREQVYDVLLTEVGAQVTDCVAQARREHGLRPQLTTFITAMQQLSAADPEVMRFLVTARLERCKPPPPRQDAAQAVVAAVHAFYDTIVLDAVRRGELAAGTDAHAVADMLASLFWGTAFHAGFLDEAGDGSGVARQLLRVLENGLLEQSVKAPVQA
ncbi:TetR/AcrR family transcriptional regulator [Mycolicibacterium chubuense]|uniref:TetR/AcrR family transcriptional regulator n=1 Tax=Mycolicibacterium chubuense TaxID=1800 RepID=UPI0002E851E0|nr:TetR/AcrR family transcriptional regulator [Mycolicibacterium chubuense]